MKYLFREIVDMTAIEEAMSHFHNLTGIPFNIADNDGELLAAVGAQDVCMKFHRACPETLRKCRAAEKLAEDAANTDEPYLVYECDNGLIHAAKPILVDGIHLATVFLEQFFFTPPNLDLFRARARRYGFEEDPYLEAVRRAPVIPREKVALIMRFFARLGTLISQAGFREKITRELILSARESWLWEIGADLRYRRVEGYSKRILGYDPEEMTGKSLREFQADREDRFPENALIPRPDGEWDLGLQTKRRLLTREGRVISVLSNAVAIFDNRGKLTGYRGIDKDVTDREKAQERLRESERRFRQLFNSMDSGFALLELLYSDRGEPEDARFVEVNPAFARVTGITAPGGLAGKKVSEVSPLFLGEDLPAMARTVATGESIFFEKHSPDLNRHFRFNCYRPERGLAACLIDDITRIKEAEQAVLMSSRPEIHGTGRDTAELMRIQQRLDHARKVEAVGRLAGGLAHEFNNFLHAMLGYTELLEADLAGNPGALRKLGRIREVGYKARDLIKRLLNFSQMQVFSPHPCDLNRIAEEALLMLKPSLGEEIAIDFRPAPGLPAVMTDPVQINQVLVNLCLNARDAMNAKGRITISSGSERAGEDDSREESVFISVADTGPGIPPELLPHIFEPFFTSKEIGKGTGLGLSTAYAIARRHGGDLTVDQPVSGGAVFTLRLPALPDRAVPAPEKKKQSRPGKKRAGTILLAEDDSAVRELTARILSRAGYKVVAARDGREALSIFEDNPDSFDILILDLIMPEMNGRRTYEEAARIRPSVPVLFCSAYGDDLVTSKLLDDLPGRFLRKPYSSGEILEAIEKIRGRGKRKR